MTDCRRTEVPKDGAFAGAASQRDDRTRCAPCDERAGDEHHTGPADDDAAALHYLHGEVCSGCVEVAGSGRAGVEAQVSCATNTAVQDTPDLLAANVRAA